MKFKIFILMGFLSTLFGFGQNKQSKEEKNIVNILQYDTSLIDLLEIETKSTVEQAPKFNEYAEQVDEKSDVLCFRITDEEEAFNYVFLNKENYINKGYNIVVFEDDNYQKFIGLFKNMNDFDVLVWRQTNGINYDIDTADLIVKLKEWKGKYDFILVGCAMDWLQVNFTSNQPNYHEFAKEVYEFCPDVVDQGTETIELLAESMEEINGIYLWWD